MCGYRPTASISPSPSIENRPHVAPDRQVGGRCFPQARLYTLSKLGYVGSENGRTYALRPRILTLGHAYLSSTPLATAVQPLLDQISDELHESSSMAVLEGEEILYIARSSTTTRLMSIDLGLGSRLL